jgi:hypothetical protein
MRSAKTAVRFGTLRRIVIPLAGTYAQDVKGEGCLRITERTYEKLYEVGRKKLTPGKSVRIRRYGLTREGKWELKSQRRGTVLALYPHHFLVDTGNGKRECFRYNQMFGTEDVRVHP